MGRQIQFFDIIKRSEDFIQIQSEPHHRNDYTISPQSNTDKSKEFAPSLQGSQQDCKEKAQINSILELISPQNFNMHHQVNQKCAFENYEKCAFKSYYAKCAFENYEKCAFKSYYAKCAFENYEMNQGIGAQRVGYCIIKTGSKSEHQPRKILVHMEKGSECLNLTNHLSQHYGIFVQSSEWIDQKESSFNLPKHQYSFNQTPLSH